MSLPSSLESGSSESGGTESDDHAGRSARLLAEHTEVARPAIVPELEIRLASKITPVWEASEAALGVAEADPPFWAFAWAGGQAIARYILDHPQVVEGRRVLDFASGCGLAGLAAARAGARSVLCVDIDPVAALAARAAADLNGLTVDTLTEDIVGEDLPVGIDLVLAGDVCYIAPMSARVVAWLRSLAGAGVDVLLGDPGRRFAPSAGLREVARYDIPTSLDIEDDDSKHTRVWELLAGPE